MPEARVGLGLAAVGGKLYAVGGRGVEAGRVFIYDPAAGVWSTARSNLPAPRARAAVVALGTDIYVIGGIEDGKPTARDDIFDTARDTWRAGPSLPIAREGHAAALLDGRIHVLGGESLSPPKTYGDHFVLANGAWSRAAPLPTPRHGAVAGVAGGKLFVVGGSPGAGVYTVFTQTDVVDIYSPGK
jgi:N-acetylneuraminic acid mutarotase